MRKDMGLMLAAAALVLVAGYFIIGKMGKKSAPTGSQTIIGGSPDQILGAVWVVPGSQQDQMLAQQDAGLSF